MNVLLGNGNGTFLARNTYEAQGNTREIAFADVTGDGINDAIVGSGLQGSIAILQGNSNGSFKAATTIVVTSFAAATAGIIRELHG